MDSVYKKVRVRASYSGDDVPNDCIVEEHEGDSNVLNHTENDNFVNCGFQDERAQYSGDDVSLDCIIEVKVEDSDESNHTETCAVEFVDTVYRNENLISENVWYPGVFEEKFLSGDTQLGHPVIVKSAYEYFKQYFPDNHYTDAATYTNMYHLNTHGTKLNTSAMEIKKLYGVTLLIGCFPYPRIEMYWKKELRVDLIANAISRTRFKKLRAALHYLDVNQTSASSSNVFWKIQPIIDTVRDRCRSLPRDVCAYSVDTQVIRYTGRCPGSQFVRNTLMPVGLKNFVITTSKGLVVDFELYQGEKTVHDNRSLGLGPAVVLRLVETIPKGSFIFFDHYFTTIPLLFELLELGYRATGIVTPNRIKGAKFKVDRQMARGESEELLYNNGIDELACVKWKDTKCVTALSTISGTNPTTTVKRWNIQTKCYQSINCPNIIHQYNQNMSGVDVVEQIVADYDKTCIKSRKWSTKVINYMIDLALFNSWMEYRQDCVESNVPTSRIMDLLDFKLEVAEALIASVKKERRESSEEDEPTNEPKRPRLCSALPCTTKRSDRYDHWPVFDSLGSARHCRLETCKARTRCRCEKCNIYLCLSSQKNCFKQFHVLKK